MTMPDPHDRSLPPAGDDTRPGDGSTGTPAAAADPAPAVRPPAGRKVTASLALPAGIAVLALLAALAMWFDTRRVQQALRIEVAQRLAGVEASTQAAGTAQTRLATDLRDAQAKITLLDARLAESQAEQAALEALYRDLAPSRDEIALSEIEQVLLVANQQLHLAGNVPSALTALQLADAKLQRLERPQFVPLRRALSRDMDRLKAVPFVDVAGMSLKLDQAQGAVDTLPLGMDERLAASPPDNAASAPDVPSWMRLLREIWADLKQLIRIEVTDRPAAPLVPAAQQYFLRENLKLRLLTARIALLARDDASFQSDLAAADAWVKQYFDTRTKPVQAMQATLRQLAATAMAGELPDLARSFEALRVLRLAQERAPTPGRSPAPSPSGR
jgi:uroporphyrin-3 C-methyltransferase